MAEESNLNSALSSSYKFKDLCEILENISKEKRPTLKKGVLENFLESYRKKHANLRNNTLANLYPIVRLIIPRLERERGSYGMKEKNLAKAIINIFCFDKTSPFAIELLKSTDEISNVVYKGLKDRYYTNSNLSISDINKYLDELADYQSNNNPKAKHDVLFKLLKQLSAFEQKWLIRVILKDTKLGLGRDNILKCIHRDAVKLYEHNTNLSTTCETLIDPNTRLHEIAICLFDAFNPMLSQRCDKKQFNTITKNDAEFIVENKFDGERFQLHMHGGKFEYFSRRGFIFSDKFGSDFKTGLFTPLLINAFAANVASVILDGEMMGWNTKTKQFASKGMNFDVKRLTDYNTIQPCFCVFDVVYFNGSVVTDKPLRERKELLQSIVKQRVGIIIISTWKVVGNKQELLNIFNKSVDDKEEGIVFKDPQSKYIPNDRNGGWWKMKLEFFQGVMSDLDLLIMGGYFGQGRRRNKVAGFLLGVLDRNNTGSTLKFLSMDKVTIGLSDSELEQLDRQIGSFFQPVDKSNTHETHGLFWGKETPDVWIKPTKSCVLQIRASELVRNFGTHRKYLTDYSLRFARIQKIRDDKKYCECLTTDELHDLVGSSTVIAKLDKRHLDLTDLAENAETKRRKKSAYVVKYDDIDADGGDLLEGRRFVVLSGEGAWDKAKVELAIRANGGVVEQTNGPKTYCLLAGDHHLRTSTYRGDIVHVNWLRSILNEGTFEEFRPIDTIRTSVETDARFSIDYDKYGDHYMLAATMDTLKFVLSRVKSSGDYVNCLPCEIDELNSELGFVPSKNYRSISVYFDKFKVINDDNSMEINDFTVEEVDFKFYGGTARKFLCEDVDYVLTSKDANRHEIIRYFLINEGNKHTKIITTIPTVSEREY